MRILVDTNVIIDALASREPWRENAEKIFLLAANKMTGMYITASSATDIYYLIRKYLHDSAAARKTMKDLFSLVGVLDVYGIDCIEAVSSPIIDYEDAVVDTVAAKYHMDYIVTRNIKDYKNSRVSSITPEDFLEQLKNETDVPETN